MLANLGSWERERERERVWVHGYCYGFLLFFIFLCLEWVRLEKREQICICEREIAKGKKGRGVIVLGLAAAEQQRSICSKPRKTQNKHKNIDLYPKPMRAKPKTTNLQAAAIVTFSLQASVVTFAAIITLAKRARSRGKDRGLERFDGDCGIAQR